MRKTVEKRGLELLALTRRLGPQRNFTAPRMLESDRQQVHKGAQRRSGELTAFHRNTSVTLSGQGDWSEERAGEFVLRLVAA